MIAYYLSLPERSSIFDKLFENRGIWTEKYNINTIQSLSSFVARDKALRDISHFIVDLGSGKFSAENVTEAVELLSRFSPAHPVILAQECEETERLFGELAARNIRNTIKYTDNTSDDDLLMEMKECLSDNGKSFASSAVNLMSSMLQTVRDITQSKITLKEGQTITVGISGACQRIGTTTQAMLIYEYLKCLDLSPCLIDIRQKFVPLMQLMYGESEDNEGVVNINDKCMSIKVPTSAKYNSFILDFGVLDKDNVTDFMCCDVRIVVSGSKPWELPSLAGVIKLLSENDTLFWLSFTDEQARIEVSEQIPNKSFSALPYTPDIWKLGSMEFYNRNLLPVLKECT